MHPSFMPMTGITGVSSSCGTRDSISRPFSGTRQHPRLAGKTCEDWPSTFRNQPGETDDQLAENFS
jgi:hypothetical protein